METKSIHNNNYSSSTPPLNLFFYSNPSSPRFSTRNDDDDNISLLSREAFSSVPFSWEFTPGIPISTDVDQFDFSGQLDMMLTPSLSSADELFDRGKIKPLRPPPRLVLPPPTSPTLSKSPKQRSKPRFEIDDPFETALRSSSSSTTKNYGNHQTQVRGRTVNTGTRHGNGNGRKGLSRSLSPLRVSEFALLHQHQQQQEEEGSRRSSSLSSSSTSKKWRLKDLFLFRSASEGTSRSLGSKYSFLSRWNSTDSDNRGSSFRSSTSGGSVSKRRGNQANESHSTASEELKNKRTSSPYRRSFLGYLLGFQPHPSTLL